MQTETCCGVDLTKLAARLRVLAEPSRLRIIGLLMDGVQCNCVMGEKLDMPANLISHHLHILTDSGLVRAERSTQDARWLYYSIDPDALVELSEIFRTFFDPDRIQPRQPACGPDNSTGNAKRCRKC
jgi:ArsR family transcriptional regulator